MDTINTAQFTDVFVTVPTPAHRIRRGHKVLAGETLVEVTEVRRLVGLRLVRNDDGHLESSESRFRIVYANGVTEVLDGSQLLAKHVPNAFVHTV